jgi:hypothetical protein
MGHCGGVIAWPQGRFYALSTQSRRLRLKPACYRKVERDNHFVFRDSDDNAMCILGTVTLTFVF